MAGRILPVKIDEVVCGQQIEPVGVEKVLVSGYPLGDRSERKSFERMETEVNGEVCSAERVAQYVLLIQRRSGYGIVGILAATGDAERVRKGQSLPEPLFQVVIDRQVISLGIGQEGVRGRRSDGNLRITPNS